MTTNRIDTLAKWYESAERITKTNLPGDGDFIICPYIGGIGYIIERSKGGWASNIVLPDEDCRILSRAPKPKPAWHDAIAVIATWDSGGDEEHRGLWTYNGAGMWINVRGTEVHRDYLTDVSPLIEAKVTDEMVKRARAASMKWEFGGISENATHAILAAALGLETV